MKHLILLLFSCMTCFCADQKVEDFKRHVCRVLPSIEGWCSQEKALNFVDLVLETKPQICVEIGVFGGASFFPVASALKFLDQGIAIGIDPWDRIECIRYYDPIEDEANLRWWGKVNLHYVHNSYESLLKAWSLEKYSLTLRMNSEKAAAEFDPESIDILYIDGNHSDVISTLDVQLYLPKVRSGGYIWMNDSLWPDRQAAVGLLMQSCEVVKLIEKGNCILFKKK